MDHQNPLNLAAIASYSSDYYSNYDAVITEDLRNIELSSEPAKAQEEARAILELIEGAARTGQPVAFTGGFVYERKGYFSTDTIGNDRNRSYGSDGDDLILQLTVRVPASEATRAVAKASREARLAREEEALNARKAALNAEIAELQARRASLDS